MAFIEPRLIHLLNDSTTPQLARADLPPLRLAYSRPSERPFPLEPDTSHREDKPKAPLATSHGAPLAPSRGPDDAFAARDIRKEDDGANDRGGAVSSTAYMQLRLLVGEDRDTTDSSFSLSKILDEVPDNSKDDTSNKKRHRNIATKDDFVQLPQPVKKQKPIQPQVMPAMPPIINGLHEPPPDAALFPPIASNDFNEPESNQLKPLRDYAPVTEEKETEKPPDPEPTPTKASKAGSGKTRKKAMKPRRKWSEAETNHLLLGVNRHGVGKWTDILADPDFNFNDRTAGDLKDRFRTCCPNELRRTNSDTKIATAAMPTTPTEPKAKAKTGLLSENILIAQEEPVVAEQSQVQGALLDADGIPKAKKSRAHRKKLEDLAELGIHGPFKKSHRRERRPFTDQDDKQILEGLDKYGPAWTKIQRDSRFSLSGRQPTDLRDRVRNKYPSVYQKIEKGLFQIKDGRGGDTLEPTVSMSITNTLQPNRPPPMEAALNRTNSKEDLPRWPLSVLDNGESPAVQQAFDFGETTTAAFMGSAGEMDISRLLLDDSQVDNLPMRQYAAEMAPEPMSP
ncbi:telomere-associated protein 1 [Colletotrichum sp. SAR 10_70]|nr:telomere-associated protein 1 [Colletotrichum sp. SAR 10_71]KAI8160781.1 telomere-associated protein 1 [Colletotrichum sp. SAR 10_70]KAI8221704.1 telomere-associated protein 1 [Colletotrichum sp. SAR 10_86]KAJ4997309.1 telomere-associated protein 1 [Colletotrichum sp. SAR 10_66]